MFCMLFLNMISIRRPCPSRGPRPSPRLCNTCVAKRAFSGDVEAEDLFQVFHPWGTLSIEKAWFLHTNSSLVLSRSKIRRGHNTNAESQAWRSGVLLLCRHIVWTQNSLIEANAKSVWVFEGPRTTRKEGEGLKSVAFEQATKQFHHP